MDLRRLVVKAWQQERTRGKVAARDFLHLLRVRLISFGAVALVSAAIVNAVVIEKAEAGAWTLKAGTGQAIVTGLYSQAGGAFDDSRDATRSVDFEKATGSVFGEYGLTDIFTLIGAGEFGSDRSGSAFSDPALFELAIGGRLRLWRGNGFVVSTQVSALVDDETDVLGRRSIGWDAPMLESRMLAGYSFSLGDWPAFVDLEAGYRYRFGGHAPDELRLDTTFGIRPFENVQLLVQDFSTVSIRVPEDVAAYDYHKLQGSVVYDLSQRWSVQAGGFATVSGRNALQERGLIAAVWYRF